MVLLYTFVMDYLGGTYVSQAEADTLAEAMRIWLKDLKIDEINEFDSEDLSRLIIEDFIHEEPILLSGLTNIWCFTVKTKSGMGLVNVIKTDTRN